jgi:LTXXQ motif family protein
VPLRLRLVLRSLDVTTNRHDNDLGERPMMRLTMPPRAFRGLCLVLGATALMWLATSAAIHAQGLVKGLEQGAKAGNKAAGPVGGVLGGAIGGVVGVFTGVLGVPANNDGSVRGPVQGAPSGNTNTAPKGSKTAKGAKGGKPAQEAELQQLTADQIVAESDKNIDRIKAELQLTPEQEQHWAGFNSAMHYLGHNGADRLNLRIARAKRDPPDDIIEQMRNEAQFLNDRAVDQRSVADAAEPLFASLNDKQKAIFIEEMVRLSRERGLD